MSFWIGGDALHRRAEIAGRRSLTRPPGRTPSERAFVLKTPGPRVKEKSRGDSFSPPVTAELLIEAFDGSTSCKPQLLVDGGVENYNSAVDKLVDSSVLKRILAETKIRYSNSLIESWWRVIKHQWLFLNTLDNVTSVRKLVAFYVEQHNSHLPHSAFNGQTPDEMYFGAGNDIPKKLEEDKLQARELRLKSKPRTELPRVFSVGGRRLLRRHRIETGLSCSDPPQTQSTNPVSSRSHPPSQQCRYGFQASRIA